MRRPSTLELYVPHQLSAQWCDIGLESISCSIILIKINYFFEEVCLFLNLTGGDIVNVCSVRIAWCGREQSRNMKDIDKL